MVYRHLHATIKNDGILAIRAGANFVDEQRVGPYDFWHHKHFIEPVEKGVLMTDILSCKPPLGSVGSIANSLFIRRKLNEKYYGLL